MTAWLGVGVQPVDECSDGERSAAACQLMRIGAVVHQPRVIAFDVNNRVFNLPTTRHDLLFKIRHRSRLLDFGTRSFDSTAVVVVLGLALIYKQKANQLIPQN